MRFCAVGSYATEVHTLLNSTLCNLDLTTSDTCDLDALEYASDHPEIFKLVRFEVAGTALFFLDIVE